MRKYIIVFLLFNAVLGFGQTKTINLSKIKKADGVIAVKLQTIYMKYQAMTSSNFNNDNCFPAYINVVSELSDFNDKLYDDLKIEEVEQIIKHLKDIEAEKKKDLGCIEEDFKGYYSILENEVTRVKSRSRGTNTESEDRKPDSKGNIGVLDILYYIILFILIVCVIYLLFHSSKVIALKNKFLENLGSKSNDKSNQKQNTSKGNAETDKPVHNDFTEKGKLSQVEINRLNQFKEEEEARINKEKLIQYQKNQIDADRKKAEIERQKMEEQKQKAEDVERQIQANRQAEIERQKLEEERQKILEEQRLQQEALEKQKQLESAITEQFLSIPSGEMEFSNNANSRYTHGKTFYRFLVKYNNQATFEFYSEATPFAIDKPQTHIIPACTPLNARENNATTIKTVKSGTAHLDGDKWIVDEKAQIRYEY